MKLSDYLKSQGIKLPKKKEIDYEKSPYINFDIDFGFNLCKEIYDNIEIGKQLHPSLDEALNTGDGTYKP